MRFDMICEANGIEHRLTKPSHPWTNGQVERMNRTIKEAAVKRNHNDSHDQLRPQAQDTRRPHSLRGHLQNLDFRARTIQPQPDSTDAGTENLGMWLALKAIVTT